MGFLFPVLLGRTLPILVTLKFQDYSKINVGENPFLKATLKKAAFLESRRQLSLDS